MLSDRCPVCLSVCNDVGVFLPNGWMDQDETWRGGRPRPGHIVLDRDPAPPPPKRGGAQQPPTFRPMYCGQTAEWIKVPLDMELGLGLGHIVLMGTQLTAKRHSNPPPA